jgi:3-methyladenine DNA glycosylase Tag
LSISGDHKRSRPKSLAEYLAVMSRAVFQAGLSWAAIDGQWKGLCEAFDDFEPRRVARFGARDIKRIMTRPGILHSQRKIEATITNAKTMLELERLHGSLRNYLRSFKNYDALLGEVKQRFSHVGDISAYYFLFRVGEHVPSFARWIKTVEGAHPRIKEMVARQQARE